MVSKKEIIEYLKNKSPSVEKAVASHRSMPFRNELNRYKQKLSNSRNAPQSRTQRLGSAIARGLSYTQRGAITRKLYGQPVVPFASGMNNFSPVRRSGFRGRPKGTTTYLDPSTGQKIGVYEYRKILNARLRQQRSEYLRSRAINPQQQQILNQIEARRNAVAQNPERQVIPSTTGSTPMGSYFNEIDSYANLF